MLSPALDVVPAVVAFSAPSPVAVEAQQFERPQWADALRALGLTSEGSPQGVEEGAEAAADMPAGISAEAPGAVQQSAAANEQAQALVGALRSLLHEFDARLERRHGAEPQLSELRQLLGDLTAGVAELGADLKALRETLRNPADSGDKGPQPQGANQPRWVFRSLRRLDNRLYAQVQSLPIAPEDGGNRPLRKDHLLTEGDLFEVWRVVQLDASGALVLEELATGHWLRLLPGQVWHR